MNRDNFLFAIIGALLGFIIGFMLHGVMTEREAVTRTAAPPGQQGPMPPNHPPVGSDSGGGNEVFAQVQEAMKRARENPNDFEAQLTAAKLEYQIERFDAAIEFLLRANQLRPDDYTTIAFLGEANMDARRYDEAEKWYRAALVKKPKEIPALDGLCFVLLNKGDAKGAETQINRLAQLDPDNQDLPQFRKSLEELKAGKK